MSRMCPCSMCEIFAMPQPRACATAVIVSPSVCLVGRRSALFSAGRGSAMRWKTSRAMARLRQRRIVKQSYSVACVG